MAARMNVLDSLERRLRELLGEAAVLTAREDLLAYAFDGTAALRQLPRVAVFARTSAQVAQVLDHEGSLGPPPTRTQAPGRRSDTRSTGLHGLLREPIFRS